MRLVTHHLVMSHCTVSILLYSRIHHIASQPSFTGSSPVSDQRWNLFGKPGDGYYTELEIGTPPQKSSWTGHLGRDLAQFPSVPCTENLMTDMALITTSENFYVNNSNWQGILGLAFSALAQPQGVVVPWFDGLVTQNQNLTANVFTLELCGPSMKEGAYHHFGRFFIGNARGGCPSPVVSSPIRRAWFYEVLVVAVGVGDRVLNLPCAKYNTDKSIVDSGTSNLRLPSQVFKLVVAELQQQVSKLVPPLSQDFWSGSEEVCWSQENKEWDAFPNISVHLAHNNNSAFTITIPPQSYLRPAPNSVSDTTDCWMLGIDESPGGTVLGAVVLEGLCVTFDRGQSVIGFSESRCGPTITLGEIYNLSDVKSCVYVPSVADGLTLASYVMVAFLGLLSLPLVLAALRWTLRSVIQPRLNREVPFLTLDETNT